MAEKSREEYVKFFKAADKNGDGVLNLSELEAILTKNGYSKGKVKEYFQLTDTSGDGLISLDEFLVAMGHATPNDAKEARMRQIFRDFDTDGNGLIDKDELRAVFEGMKKHFTDEELDKMMAMMDKSGDGKVDYEEFINYMFGGFAGH